MPTEAIKVVSNLVKSGVFCVSRSLPVTTRMYVRRPGQERS